ncbi:hypothetical protein BMS3Abin09_00883 [bacterium BMS3Abin09]|nr:hypothetical protein BMS3Abin09_00883 [bacterium BMS3Abin09]
MFCFLARNISFVAHSLIWLTDPGADGRSSENIVCIESITITFGESFFATDIIPSREVSGRSTISSDSIFSLSALIFICSGDSSPDT